MKKKQPSLITDSNVAVLRKQRQIQFVCRINRVQGGAKQYS